MLAAWRKRSPVRRAAAQPRPERAHQGFDLVFGGVLDHFLARETALARPDMPLLDRFFRA